MRCRIFVALFALAFSFAVAAEQPSDVAQIVSQQQEIRSGVKSGTGRYKAMPESTRLELLQRQERLFSVLDGKQTTDQLSEQERLQAFNTLEWIEAAINNAESERMVCRSEKTIGSNRTTRVCKTVAQMEKEREEARKTMLRGSRCGDSSCLSN